MAADSLTAAALDAPGDRDRHGPGWREHARSAVYWGVGYGLPMLAVRGAARRGDLAGRLTLAPTSGNQVWEVLAEARARGPLVRSRLSYLTVDHAAVREILASPDFRSGGPARADSLPARVLNATAPRVAHPLAPPSLLVTEPPDHTRYRRLVTRVFTVRAVERLRVRTEEIARGLLDALDTSAPVDLISSYCGLLPVTVISEILGVPPAQRGLVLELGTRTAASLDFGLSWRRFRAVTAGLRDFAWWLDAHIEQLRRHPGEDLLSQLIQARDEEGALNDRELKATAGLVLGAGFETTVNLLGNAIALFDQNPGQLDRLRAEPALWPNAVDEALRVDPPVLMTGRVCTRTTSVAGVDVPEGVQVVTVLAGANRDPQVFTDPGRFDVARENARDHVSFSGGRHYCLGASLARSQLRSLFTELLRTLPDIEVGPPQLFRSSSFIHGVKRMDCSFTPRA